MNVENIPNQPRMEQRGGDVLLWIKAVPGASRDQVAGLVGNRLKVRIAAPPEDGKANKAICKVIAKALGVKSKQITIDSGENNPEKIVRIAEMQANSVECKLSG